MREEASSFPGRVFALRRSFPKFSFERFLVSPSNRRSIGQPVDDELGDLGMSFPSLVLAPIDTSGETGDDRADG